MRRLFALLLCLLQGACGDSAGGQGGGESETGALQSSSDTRTAQGCLVAVQNRAATWVDSFFGIGIYAGLQSSLDPSYEDGLGIRLRTGTGYLDNIAPYEQVAGSFDLSAAIENDYRSCRHCVFALMDVSGDHIQHLYLAVRGTMTLESVDIDRGEILGNVRHVELREIEATGYYAWGGPLPNAPCMWIESLDFDTRARAGGMCRDVEDCPNTQLMRCTAGRCVLR